MSSASAPASLALRLALIGVLALGAGLFAVTRPLTAPLAHTVEMKDMSWVEIRSAIEQGFATAIVPTGGVEQSGPHMITGKHQHIIGLTARLIAEAHGKALVAPVMPYVPQGDYDPPSGNLLFPGTIGIPPAAFSATLEGIARSLKRSGFSRIVFIGDHGQNQTPQEEVASRLNREWGVSGPRVLALTEYYTKGNEAQIAWLKTQGETDASIGDHAGMQDTAELMFAHPEGVRLERLGRLIPALEHDGASGEPARATPERGRMLIDLKVKAALAQLTAAGF